jgi:hypothetical protein
MTQPSSVSKSVFLAWAVFIAITSISFLKTGVDYIGPDNDDVMRLVQIRDLLSGQSWFDLNQYRLGLDGGTLMHWSRLIDAPIAGLIILFSIFLSPLSAEAVALYIWPLLTALPVINGFAYSLRAMCGASGVIIGALSGAIFAFGVGKFGIGAIDHHNVQLAIFALITACLLSPTHNWLGYAFAGFLAALAIAIGAETTPLVAVVCGIVAISWAIIGGVTMRRPTRIFGLSMALFLTIIFYATTPAHHYSTIVCDALSLGFYAIGVAGAVGLYFAAALFSYQGRTVRFMVLAVIGVFVGAVALMIAPNCLSNPISDLDPFLIEMWLNNVTEARSISAQLSLKPYASFGFYMVPILAIVLCLYRIWMKDRTEQHLKLFVLIFCATLISFIQIRGSIFSTMLGMIPLAVLITELRLKTHANPKNHLLSLAFIITVILSLPIAWKALGTGLSAVLSSQNHIASSRTTSPQNGTHGNACNTENALSLLAAEPKGLVMGPSNLGVSILRFTQHRAISAPYHRNELGMLAEIYTSVAEPTKAMPLLAQARINYIALCKADPQVKLSKDRSPNGLYAQLLDGQIPEYLELLEASLGQPIEIYRVKSQ